MHALQHGHEPRGRWAAPGWLGGNTLADAESERLQFLARLEAHSLAGRDADFLPRAWIPSDAGLARADVEHTESAQLDPLTLAKCALHGLEDALDSLLCFGSGHARLIHHCVNDVELNHTSLRFPNGKLC